MGTIRLTVIWFLYLLALPAIIAADAVQDVWDFLRYPITAKGSDR